MEKQESISPESIFLILEIVVFIAPLGLFTSEGFATVMGMSWSMTFNPLIFQLDTWIHPLKILYIPRVMYPYYMMRVYKEKTRLRTAFWCGLIGELFVVVYALFSSTGVFQDPQNVMVIGIPIPILLITGLLITMKYRVPDIVPKWLDDKDDNQEI